MSVEQRWLLLGQAYRTANSSRGRRPLAEAGKLDHTHLNHWAAESKISDLLTRAQREATNGLGDSC
jgi:hypothetical protein